MAKKSDRERRREEFINSHSNGDDGISFNMVNEHAVDRLRRNGDIELPRRRVDIPRDQAWNTRQMASRLLRGINNGDDINTIADSLTSVIGNNRSAAIRNARTMFTGAENTGRLDSYRELESQGVVQSKVWISTPDDRTREEHLAMDGEEVDLNDTFSNGCEYPGDPAGAPETVYNCRCSMRSHIIGFRRANGSISRVNYERDRTLHNEQIEEERERREERTPAYRTATNRREALNILREDLHFNIQGNTADIVEDLLVENTNRLSELNSRFDAIPTGTPLRVKPDDDFVAYVGYTDNSFTAGTSSLNLSSAYFGSTDFRENQMRYSEDGWNMPLSSEFSGTYSITHEYGHMIQHNLMFNDEYIRQISSVPSSEVDEYASNLVDALRANHREEILSIARENNPDFDLMSNISEYGRANDAEFFAEAFANAFCGNPNELGLAMEEWLRRKGL